MAVHKLLVESRGKEVASLSDYDLMAKLETIVAAQRKHEEERQCLEAGLKQMELGFNTGFQDMLTLVVSK